MLHYKQLIKQYNLKIVGLQYLIILAMIFIVKPNNFLVFGLTIGVTTMFFQIGYNYYKKEKLITDKTFKSFVKVSLISMAFFFFWEVMGAISIILGVLVICAYKIYKSWGLFKHACNYGADILGDVVDRRKNNK